MILIAPIMRLSLAALIAVAPGAWCCCLSPAVGGNILPDRHLEQADVTGQKEASAGDCCSKPQPKQNRTCPKSSQDDEKRSCPDCSKSSMASAVCEDSQTAVLTHITPVSPVFVLPISVDTTLADLPHILCPGLRYDWLSYGGDSLRSLSCLFTI